jgi:hypothetical protein
MPAAANATLLLSLNGGAPTRGGITSSVGTTVQLSAQSQIGWTSQKWQITDYPPGFAQPAGWSTDPVSGAYFFTGLFPPSFSLSLWGKYLFTLIVNGGLTSGAVDPTLTDTSTAISVPEPTMGLLDTAYRESNQFDAIRQWVGAMKVNWRTIATRIGALSRELVLYAGSQKTNGSHANDISLMLFNPATRFPGWTHATLEVSLWADVPGGASIPNWAQSTSYSTGNIVAANGGADATSVLYVCTTGGTSSATGTGPVGFGTGLTDGPGSAVRWRAATATLNVIFFNTPLVVSVIATLTTSRPFNDALVNGLGLLVLTVDLTAALTGISQTIGIDIQLAGDPADTGSPALTACSSGHARIIFT